MDQTPGVPVGIPMYSRLGRKILERVVGVLAVFLDNQEIEKRQAFNPGN